MILKNKVKKKTDKSLNIPSVSKLPQTKASTSTTAF